MSYLNKGPTINCKCGVVLAILKCRDLSTAVIDGIEFEFEIDVRGDILSGGSVLLGGGWFGNCGNEGLIDVGRISGG